MPIFISIINSRNGLGDCLLDEPEVSLYKVADVLPGTVYDADQQCKILFPGSSKCSTEADTFCEMLMCEVKPKSCMSDREPPADGTKCGENKVILFYRFQT